jgi:long-chain acyl-CoA synthetase
MHPVLDTIANHAATRGDHLALADETLRLDYRGLKAVGCGLAARIGDATSNPRVGLLLPTSAGAAVSILSCWCAGRVPVPLNFLLSPAELGKIVQDAELDLLVTIDHFAPLAEGLGLKTLLLGKETLQPGTGTPPGRAATDLGVLLYTSGTTAEPKGVCLSFDNLVQNVRACVAAVKLTQEHVFLGLLPQFHAFGFTATTLVPLMLGATAHYRPRFSPTGTLEVIREQRVSVFITIASMFGALAGMKNATRADFASLTHAVSGGEPLPDAVSELFEQRFGVRILEGYGMTEASPVVCLNTHAAYKRGTVGPPLPGVTVVAVDEHGNALPAGADGELTVRGHCVMQGYLNKPEQTAAVLKGETLYTGDIGHVDADGFVRITGRAKDMMIVGGENVFPFEIESVLVQHPAVAEAAVIGVVDGVRGEVPTAYVLLEEGKEVDAAALRAFCREHLAGYKVPRMVEIVADLPRGPTGKILKRALREGAVQ